MFVDPDLEVAEEAGSGRFQPKSISYTDLLTAQDNDGKSLDHILVSGVVGTGKTSLLSNIAFEWAMLNKHREERGAEAPKAIKSSVCRLKSFKLVLFLDASAITREMDLIDAIIDQLLPNVSRNILENYLLANSSSCLYLFDGYERFQGSQDKVFNSPLHSDSCIFVTSRPNGVGKFTKTNHKYVRVSLKGFSVVGVCSFVRNTLRVDKHGVADSEETKNMITSIYDTTFTSNLAHFPFVLTLLCHIWKESHKLPKTMSVLHKEIIECLSMHYKERESSLSSIPRQEVKECAQRTLGDIGKIPADDLKHVKSRDRFQIDEFDPETFTTACSLGIITCKSNSAFFIHSSFQELCAAWYLAQLANTNENQFKTYLPLMHEREAGNILKLCCGLSQGGNVDSIEILDEPFTSIRT